MDLVYRGAVGRKGEGGGDRWEGDGGLKELFVLKQQCCAFNI